MLRDTSRDCGTFGNTQHMVANPVNPAAYVDRYTLPGMPKSGQGGGRNSTFIFNAADILSQTRAGVLIPR